MNKKEEEQLMKKHGITREVKYRYKNHKYNNLEKAVNFAVMNQEILDEDTTVYWDTTKEL